MKHTLLLVAAVSMAAAFACDAVLIWMHHAQPERPVTPEVVIHRVTCLPSGSSSDVVRCSGDVPMRSHARRIYLVSEPWDGGAP